MALKQNAKKKRGEAERAGEHYCLEKKDCIITRRAIRTQFQSVDFFASDIVGKRSDGSHVYVQVTAGQSTAVSARRKKLEQYPWHQTDTVELLQLVQTPDPANARRTKYFFRVHEYRLLPGKGSGGFGTDNKSARRWTTADIAIDVPDAWFKAVPKVSKED